MTSVNAISVDGGTEIGLPNDADQMLKDRENGHDALGKNEYEDRVKQKIEDAFRGFKRMKFVGADGLRTPRERPTRRPKPTPSATAATTRQRRR